MFSPIAVGERSIAFPRRSVKAGVNRTRSLRSGYGKLLILGQPAGVHDVELRIDLPPVSNGHGPFFRQLPGRKVQRLEQAHGVGEDRAATVQPAEAAVHKINAPMHFYFMLKTVDLLCLKIILFMFKVMVLLLVHGVEKKIR